MPRRVLEGKVVSNKCDKTVTVLVERKVRDPLYGKIVRRSAKYAAHDENNQWLIGDQVAIEECSPISKRKTWKVIRGKAMGLSQAKTVDDANEKRASVKKTASESVKTAESADSDKKTVAKKAKKDE